MLIVHTATLALQQLLCVLRHSVCWSICVRAEWINNLNNIQVHRSFLLVLIVHTATLALLLLRVLRHSVCWSICVCAELINPHTWNCLRDTKVDSTVPAVAVVAAKKDVSLLPLPTFDVEESVLLLSVRIDQYMCGMIATYAQQYSSNQWAVFIFIYYGQHLY